jgi:hypothetical protein
MADIEPAPHVHRTRRVGNRVGMTVVTLVVSAGLVGLLGAGPLSTVTSPSESGTLAVTHDRVTHHEATESITVDVTATAAGAEALTVTFAGAWPQSIAVEGISPEPATQALSRDGWTLGFDVDQPGPHRVTVYYRAKSHGSLDATVTVGDESVAFSQFVLP